MTRAGASTDWVAEWQQLDGTWEHIAGPGPLKPILRELRAWRERHPGETPPETRVRGSQL